MMDSLPISFPWRKFWMILQHYFPKIGKGNKSAYTKYCKRISGWKLTETLKFRCNCEF